MTKQEVLSKLTDIQNVGVENVSIPVDVVVKLVQSIEESTGDLSVWLKENLPTIVEGISEKIVESVEENINDHIEDYDLELHGNEIEVTGVHFDWNRIQGKVSREHQDIIEGILDTYVGVPEE
jgi:hypothetical protein